MTDVAPEATFDETTPDLEGAIAVLRRGLASTPELKVGLLFTVGMAVGSGGGRLAVPILIQQILDRGVLGTQGFRPGFVYPACVIATVVVVALFWLSRATYLRLILAAENSLFGLAGPRLRSHPPAGGGRSHRGPPR